MRTQTSPSLQSAAIPAQIAQCRGQGLCTAEFVQRWHEDGGIEGTSLEWMLDRMRAPQESRT